MAEFSIPRMRMVEHLRSHYKISDERVLQTMAIVPRHKFVSEALSSQAYKDNALPIAEAQTISQPFIVAKMTELLELKGTERVLEIGGGSGYQTAILSKLAKRVYTIERIESLTTELKKKVVTLGMRNVSVRCDDGTSGWPVYAPFDAILVAAGGPDIPHTLVDQLSPQGRMVIPVGKDKKSQILVRITKGENGIIKEEFGGCSFVPLIGRFGWK